ncbi:MAG: Homoaconitase large subunit [Syntrophaceae bacterium PtaU1.Bin231]|nr:MAG: Homoaconitase large subunit [Syntrophaceae bacterium PtaU1.Bin231]
MGMTFAEKIFARKTGRETVRPGEVVSVRPDVVMTLDADAEIIYRFEALGLPKVWNPDGIVCSLDHYAPASTVRTADLHRKMRLFAREQGISRFFEVGDGLTHQIMLERGYARPGLFIVGTDSHTPSYGCIGAFSCGVGASDMLSIWATGELWFQVPESARIVLNGRLPAIIRDFTASGCSYYCAEFSGGALQDMSVAERFVLANVSVEMGVKATYVEVDEVTRRYADRGGLPYETVVPDADARYRVEKQIDVAALPPLVACPHAVDNVRPVSELEGTEIHQAFIGTCASGRIEDFATAAAILRGKRIAAGVRLLIAPASRAVLEDAIARGYLEILVKAGATLLASGCGPCAGIHEGLLGEGERCISTANRNFRGRMGSPASEIYLASAATVASSALHGVISDPRRDLV